MKNSFRIRDIYTSSKTAISFEVFPPKTPDGNHILAQALETLSSLGPDFISCTYGATGNTSAETLHWCRQIQELHKINAVAHFACLGATSKQALEWICSADKHAIHNIMALRGDWPTGQQKIETASDFHYAVDLVRLLRERYPDIGIGVAGYPEKHVQAPNSQEDLINLKRKVDAGADAVFTQVFYDNECFFRFRDAYSGAAIRVPLVPGIMPVTDFDRIKRISSLCGARFPKELENRLERAKDDRQAQFEIGVEHAVKQCQSLIDNKVPGIHFFVLNRASACEKILASLNLKSFA